MFDLKKKDDDKNILQNKIIEIEQKIDYNEIIENNNIIKIFLYIY